MIKLKRVYESSHSSLMNALRQCEDSDFSSHECAAVLRD